LITLFLTLVFGGGYTIFVLMPALNNIQNLQGHISSAESEIIAAQSRYNMHENLVETAQILEEQWGNITDMPSYFDDQSILNQFHGIITPHISGGTINVVFPAASGHHPFGVGGQSAFYITRVEVNFTAVTEEIPAILAEFSNYPVYNRIVEYTISTSMGEENMFSTVTLAIDYITLYPRMLDYPESQ